MHYHVAKGARRSIVSHVGQSIDPVTSKSIVVDEEVSSMLNEEYEYIVHEIKQSDAIVDVELVQKQIAHSGVW